MLKQLLVSVVVVVIAFVGYVYFVPGANDNLAKVGIVLPFGPAGGNTEQQSAGAGGPGNPGGAGRPGAAGGRGGFAGGGARVITVNTKPVTTAVVNDKLAAIGDGTALRSVTVTSQSGGTLDELVVKPGDHVKAGDVLAHLDSDSEKIAVDKAQLAVTDATAALSRSQELAKSNSVAKTDVTAAQLALDNANLELRDAQVALDRRTITTPINGIVGLMQVTPGNFVAAQAAVTTVEDDSSILVNFWVPERYANTIAIGKPVSASPVAIPGQTFQGTVDAVDNKIDPVSRTLEVQATVPNDQGAMRSGMSFEIAMDFQGETFPAVDPLAVQWSAEGSYVWKLTDGAVHKAMAKIVQRNSDGVLMSGAIAKGDTVVTEGVLQLSEGAKVKVLEDGSLNGQKEAEADPVKPSGTVAATK
ncbi:MAG TPA: efflux RND transporter periplasmic adaptor subunit [Devosiaceae bacterium]